MKGLEIKIITCITHYYFKKSFFFLCFLLFTGSINFYQELWKCDLLKATTKDAPAED